MDDTNFVFFWKPHEENGYLGQWYPAPFIATSNADTPDEIITFRNCETYMMYHKAILFNDLETAQRILDAADDPKAVKALGRKVRDFVESTWDDWKYDIVVEGNRQKFQQNPELKALLLATGQKELVEASPLDRIWGVGYGKVKALENRSKWGRNLLGRALMKVREELKEQNEKDQK